jgi:SAM-dependent methyltransferase
MLAEALCRFGSVEALEGAPEALDFLRQRTELKVHEGGVPAPQLPGDAFDLVTAFDVIEHIENDGEAVADIYRLTRPGGHSMITVPAGPWLWSNHDEIHHHFRRYTRRGLRGLLVGAGFSVEFISPFQTLLFPALVLMRMARKVIPPRQGKEVPKVPSSALNSLLRGVFGLERLWLSRGLRSPFGSSLVALSQKPPRAAAGPIS